MQVTLTPHAEQLLRTALDRHPGQSASEILEQALTERLEREAAIAAPLPQPRQLRQEEFKAALDRLAQARAPIPPMPNQTFPREMIYQDHD